MSLTFGMALDMLMHVWVFEIFTTWRFTCSGLTGGGESSYCQRLQHREEWAEKKCPDLAVLLYDISCWYTCPWTSQRAQVIQSSQRTIFQGRRQAVIIQTSKMLRGCSTSQVGRRPCPIYIMQVLYHKYESLGSLLRTKEPFCDRLFLITKGFTIVIFFRM